MDNTELQLQTAATQAVTMANDVKVTDQISYTEAGNARKNLKFAISRIESYWSPLIDSAYAAHKALVARKKEMTEPLEQADKAIDFQMMTFWKEQERIRQEAEAEQRRRDAEAAKAKQDALDLIAEAQTKDELTQDDMDIILLAQKESEMAEMAADVVPMVAQVKMQGVSVAKTWRAEIVDDALVPIYDGSQTLRPVDMSLLNNIARNTKGMAKIPGVRFYEESSSRVRL